jgi:hypothetical protein
MKTEKAYKVQIGILEDGKHEYINHDSTTVIAKDAAEAIKRVRLRKDTFVTQVELITIIDKV